MDDLGAADVGDAGFGETEKSYFALPYQITYRAGHLLDGHGRIDTMLIEERSI